MKFPTVAVVTLQKAERDFTNTMALLSVTQNAIFTIGLLFASFLAVYQVTMGERKVGDFVALLSYWAQISGIFLDCASTIPCCPNCL